MSDFDMLSAEEQEGIRRAQTLRKEAKQAKRKAKQVAKARSIATDLTQVTRCVVTRDEYFDACPHGLFRDPNLPPTAESLGLLLLALDAGDKQALDLSLCNYFQFSGPPKQLWDPRFNAQLAWEGFFTITSRTGPGRRFEPLPELQPFYGVLLWPHFEGSKHVRRMLAKIRLERRGYRLSDRQDPTRTWRLVEEYHVAQHGSNWLTREYFDMMKLASDDPTINFTLHCIELSQAVKPETGADIEGGGGGCSISGGAHNYGSNCVGVGASAEHIEAAIAPGCRVRIDGLVSRPELNGFTGEVLRFDEMVGRWVVRCSSTTTSAASGVPGSADDASANEMLRIRPQNLSALPPPPPPLAGEIGFSIGKVYTSLSGWTGERTASAVGTAQLVLLGRWLQQRGYAFWSLGHCYSPEMDYKRQLGHRVYTRQQFRELLKSHRGPFEVSGIDHRSAEGTEFTPLGAGAEVDEAMLLQVAAQVAESAARLNNVG